MANNLHISYDLYSPGQNYEAVIDRIKGLGSWAKIHKSYWCVSANMTPSDAVNAIKPALDTNDTVYVVDALTNAAAWHNIDPEVSEFIRKKWNR